MKTNSIALTLLCLSSMIFCQNSQGLFSKSIGPANSQFGFVEQSPNDGNIISGQYKGHDISFHAIHKGNAPKIQAMISKNNKVVKELTIEKCVPGALTSQVYVKGQEKFTYKDKEGKNHTCMYKVNQ